MNIVEQELAITFDDVLLVPQYSDIKSRADVDVSVSGLLGKLRVPILSANMDTVTEDQMAIAMVKAGGRGVFHRYVPRDRLITMIVNYNTAVYDMAGTILSIGVGDQAKRDFDEWMYNKTQTFCIDVAHGHCAQVIDMAKHIKSRRPDCILIAGNVATPEGLYALADAGVDIVKVGIGPGSLCSTRVVTGHGFPQLSAIERCAEAADYINSTFDSPIEIIADGGIRNSGDIAKALAAGADYVMIGSLFAGTDEAPGQVVKIDGKKYKQYRGMASKEVQNQLGKQAAPEGVAQLKECKGPVSNIVHELEWGLRSALTYSGARNIQEFRAKAKFIRVTPSSYVEGTPHGLTS